MCPLHALAIGAGVRVVEVERGAPPLLRFVGARDVGPAAQVIAECGMPRDCLCAFGKDVELGGAPARSRRLLNTITPLGQSVLALAFETDGVEPLSIDVRGRQVCDHRQGIGGRLGCQTGNGRRPDVMDDQQVRAQDLLSTRVSATQVARYSIDSTSMDVDMTSRPY